MSNGMDFDGESQITLTRTIDANISDVFSAWTDPALIEQWQADEAELDPFAVSGPVSMSLLQELNATASVVGRTG